MITAASTEFPEIEWEMGEILEEDKDERLLVFNGKGIDKEGNKYSGSIHYVCGDFEEIKDIQLEK